MLGSMRKSPQDFDGALTLSESRAGDSPEDLTARKLLASLKLQTGAVEEAVACSKQIVTEAPDSRRCSRAAGHGLQPSKAQRRRRSRARHRRSAESRDPGEAVGCAKRRSAEAPPR